MTRNTPSATGYLRKLNASAVAYFGVFALMLLVSAVAVADETIVGAVGVAVIALLPAWVALFAGRELVKARRLAHA